MKTILLSVIIKTNDEDLEKGLIADEICKMIGKKFKIEEVWVGEKELFENINDES